MRPDANAHPTEGTRIVALVISDRASRGEYADLGGPAISAWLSQTVTTALIWRSGSLPTGGTLSPQN